MRFENKKGRTCGLNQHIFEYMRIEENRLKTATYATGKWAHVT